MATEPRGAMFSSREQMLAYLLQPILWDWSSSVRARQNLVVACHSKVRAAYPFLTPDEQKQADEWFIRERHEGLWD